MGKRKRASSRGSGKQSTTATTTAAAAQHNVQDKDAADFEANDHDQDALKRRSAAVSAIGDSASASGEHGHEHVQHVDMNSSSDPYSDTRTGGDMSDMRYRRSGLRSCSARKERASNSTNDSSELSPSADESRRKLF